MSVKRISLDEMSKVIKKLLNEEMGSQSPINKFVYFCYNYPHDFVNQIWGQDRMGTHLQAKFDSAYLKNGSKGVITAFYIELDRDIDVSKVCDIFTQINSKGVTLDIFDLLNAILRPKDIFLKKMWHESKRELSFTDPKKMKIYVLQVMSILEQAYCSAKYLYYLVPEAIKTIKAADGSRE